MAGRRISEVTVELDVAARMRDGVNLMANVYRPDGDGPWPTLLTRTPYDKDQPTGSATLDPVLAARDGFMVVVQDTRGRFASEGDWSPLEYERQDGYDSVEWAARLPGSSGQVGMYGGSYCGSTQWMAAVERPPSLAAIAPQMTWCEPLDGLLARGGALEHGFTLGWALQQAASHLPRLALTKQERARRLATVFDDWDRFPTDGAWDLPAADPAVLRRHATSDLGARRALSDATVADWSRVAGRHDRVSAASLHIGGWHDLFIQGTLDNYRAMAAAGLPARLVVGPWAHGNATLADPTGELYFGSRSNGLGVPICELGDVNALQLAWMHRYLDDEARDEPVPGAPVRIFVMGRNEWRDEDAWPPARARTQRWFLGKAGTVSPAPPTDDEVVEYLYDPTDPVPTVGGHFTDTPGSAPGPFDQCAVEARPDVLVFTSAVLEGDLEVTGRVSVVLHAESSAAATDWVARLCDVHPDGRSFNVCDGISRASNQADDLQRIEIDLWSTSNVFLAGHRLRVHVTSSSFPRWDRNLNDAHQRIHLSPACSSYIELPRVA